VEGDPGTTLVGVEEEFLLIDSVNRRPAPRIAAVLDDAVELAGERAQEELHQAQIEVATAPQRTLAGLRNDLVRLRGQMVEAAGRHGASVVAAGSYPGRMGSAGARITADERYQLMARDNAVLARQQLICGCHIHVSINDPELAIQTMNRVRRWLSHLLALSANSPFWEAEDTGFSSFRTEVWARWPTAGPPAAFESMEEYQRVVQQLISSGTIADEHMAYWDVRPSRRFPTLEIRVADVMHQVDDVVAVAGLARALVDHCHDGTDRPSALRPELLRSASWRAARSGLSGSLVDPVDGSVRAAPEAIRALLDRLRPSLEKFGDADEVRESTGAIVRRGNGSARQREAFARRGRMDDVLDAVQVEALGDR
jgi:carboxylate-amine ligase